MENYCFPVVSEFTLTQNFSSQRCTKFLSFGEYNKDMDDAAKKSGELTTQWLEAMRKSQEE